MWQDTVHCWQWQQPLTGGIGLYKNESWGKHEKEQGSKQYFFFFFLVVSISVPVYSFPPCWVPASACLHDHLSQINFSFQISFGHGVYHHSRRQSIRGWNSYRITSSKCPWKLSAKTVIQEEHAQGHICPLA